MPIFKKSKEEDPLNLHDSQPHCRLWEGHRTRFQRSQFQVLKGQKWFWEQPTRIYQKVNHALPQSDCLL